MDDNNQTPQQPSAGLAEQYQSILDKYAQELAVTPPEPVNPEPVVGPPEPSQPEIPTPPELPPEPVMAPPVPPIPPEPPQLTPEPVTPPPEPITPPPPVNPEVPVVSQSKPNNFFKILFILSLLVFLGVLGANIYAYFFAKPTVKTATTPTLIPVPTTIVVNYCELNNQRYSIDQTFPAQDGCNTCTCQSDLTITCTNNICPTAGPTKKPVPLTVSSVFPTSGKIGSNITIYGTGFDKTNNSVVFSSNDLLVSSCTFSFDNVPSADGQKITLTLNSNAKVACGGVADSGPTPTIPAQLLATSYDVSVNTGPTNSSYTKAKLIKFTVIGAPVTPTAVSSVSPPTDLVSVVKADAIKQYTSGQVTPDQIIIGQSQIEGNFASVAFGYSSGGGSIDWLAKVGGNWKIVTSGQEPPQCSVLVSYNFPKTFTCNP